jgi:hypothetical protein
MLTDMDMDEGEDDPNAVEQPQVMTEYGCLHASTTLTLLHNNSVFHTLTGIDMFNDKPNVNNAKPQHETFTLDRYSNQVFQGIMPDTGAAGISTAGISQVQALQQIKNVTIDTSTAGQHKVRFGAGEALSIGTVIVDTPIGDINFQVLPSSTPFLLSLHDMDMKGVQFDNVNNVLIQGDKTIPITRRWGHPWLHLYHQQGIIEGYNLIEPELRQLHRRFGHPSVKKLSELLTRADAMTKGSPNKAMQKLIDDNQITVNVEGWGAAITGVWPQKRRVNVGLIYSAWLSLAICTSGVIRSTSGVIGSTNSVIGSTLLLPGGEHSFLECGV